MSLEAVGSIRMLGEAKNVGNGSFLKRELVITTLEQYPQHVLIEFVQDKCDLLDKYKVGDNVKVSINLRGREWVDPQGVTKYFNAIQGWRIEKQESNEPTPQPKGTQEGATVGKGTEEEADDLPF
jgi:hypothetical protein